MPLHAELWAGNIRDLTAARFYSSRNFDWLGFAVGENDGAIDAETFGELKNWINGPKCIAELLGDLSNVETEWIDDLAADKILVDGSNLDLYKNIKTEIIIQLAKQSSVEEIIENIIKYDAVCSNFLIDLSNIPETDLKNLNSKTNDQKIYFNLIDLNKDSIKKEGKFSGYRIEAQLEEETGIMDFSEMTSFLDAIQL